MTVIIATAPVPAPLRLDQADTVTMPKITADLAALSDPGDSPQVAIVVAEYARRYDATQTCPLGTPWCTEHFTFGDDASGCHGNEVTVATDSPGFPVLVYLSALHEPAEGHEDALVSVGGDLLTPAQALQLAAVLTDQAMRLLAGERAR